MSHAAQAAVFYGVPVLGLAWCLWRAARDARATPDDRREWQQETEALHRLYPGVAVFPPLMKKPQRRGHGLGHDHDH